MSTRAQRFIATEENPLTHFGNRLMLHFPSRPNFPSSPNLAMSRVCQITGARARRGNRIHHSGLAKKHGGIGLNHVKKVGRTFSPNLRDKRVWVPELNRFVQVRLTARALKTVSKNGAYQTLKEAGLI